MAERKISTTSEINRALLKELEATRSVQLTRLTGQHCIAIGLPAGYTVRVEGNAGDFFGALNSGASLSLNGNAGRFCGDSMISGELIVNGDCGSGAGHYMRGGTLVVKGDCRGPAGQMMRGGTLVIDGAVGRETGKYMMLGELVVVGDAGELVGENIMGGAIFVLGEPASLGLNARLSKPSPQELDRLRQLHRLYKFRRVQSDEEFLDFKKIFPETARPLIGEVRM
ncbi:MAG: hypothetical protein QW379_05180 [Thermoplasmata archaeon]